MINEMPLWEGIEDAAPVPEPVWLARPCALIPEKDTKATSTTSLKVSEGEWKPLRKSDCRRLNDRKRKMIHGGGGDGLNPDNWLVNIEGGRCRADLSKSRINYNFIRGEERELISAVWFVKEEKSNDNVILHPVKSSFDHEKIESLYQEAIAATSSLGEGISRVVVKEIMLEDESKLKITKVGNTLTMKKVPNGWFTQSLTLQRGYGEYEVEGEENEEMLGPIKHLFFAVHGIGEAWFSREDVKFAGIAEQVDSARLSLQQKQIDDWKKRCKDAKKKGNPEPAPPNRIELIPVEWYNLIHDSSSALMKSLRLTTLQSVPALRSIANDVVFDVLMYMTPSFCESVLECVTAQINDAYKTFQTVHPDFEGSGGKYSLVGHSLGSVILWDLLAIQKDLQESKSIPNGTTVSAAVAVENDPFHRAPTEVGYQAYARGEHANNARHGTWGPALTKSFSQTIPFRPECTIFLGSPLGIFLTLRGAHPLFDELRINTEGNTTSNQTQALAIRSKTETENTNPKVKVSPFTLPTNRLYNIFHPSDPVAYRIEPLLMPQESEETDIPPPEYLKVPGQDLKLHIKVKEMLSGGQKSLMSKKDKWGSLLGSALGIETAETAKKSTKQTQVEDGLKFPLGGENSRVDYSLQTDIIENEYISAVYAHSCYLANSDILSFLASLLREEAKTVNE